MRDRLRKHCLRVGGCAARRRECRNGEHCQNQEFLHDRFSRRMTSFRPDHTSSTAHTLTSTNPIGNATARITSSVMSVGTFDDFLGQETQTIASSRIFDRYRRSFAASSFTLFVKWWMMSTRSETEPASVAPSEG